MNESDAFKAGRNIMGAGAFIKIDMDVVRFSAFDSAKRSDQGRLQSIGWFRDPEKRGDNDATMC